MPAMQPDGIKANVKAFILKEFLPGARPGELTDSTPLISGGILDSLATIKLLAFLEETYGMTFDAAEADVDNLNTVSDIAALVARKLARS